MKTRIIAHKPLSKCYTIEYYPQYKSSWYTPWRRITNPVGDKLCGRNPESLIKVCQDVQGGVRPPRYKKPSKIHWSAG